MFQVNIAPCSKRWCIFLKGHIPDSWDKFSSKNAMITRTDHGYKYKYLMKLNLKSWYWNLSVEGSMLSMQPCMCWRSFTKYYCAFFSNSNCSTSKGMHKVRLYSLYGISRSKKKKRLGFIDVGWLYAKKCWNHILNALCCLFLLILFQLLRHFLKSAKPFRKLDEIHNCSLSIWFYPNLGKRRPELSAGVMK